MEQPMTHSMHDLAGRFALRALTQRGTAAWARCAAIACTLAATACSCAPDVPGPRLSASTLFESARLWGQVLAYALACVVGLGLAAASLRLAWRRLDGAALWLALMAWVAGACALALWLFSWLIYSLKFTCLVSPFYDGMPLMEVLALLNLLALQPLAAVLIALACALLAWMRRAPPRI
jgi:hypothetical protein